MPLIDPMPSDAKYINSEDVRSYIDGALTKAEAADALPKNVWQAWQRAAQAIDRAEKSQYNSHHLEAADRWIALGHAMRLS